MEQTTDVAQALKGLSVSQHIDGGPDVAHYFCAIDFGTVLTAAAVAKVCTSGSFNAEGQEDTKILVLDEVRIIDRYIGADNGKVRDVEVPSVCVYERRNCVKWGIAARKYSKWRPAGKTMNLQKYIRMTYLSFF